MLKSYSISFLSLTLTFFLLAPVYSFGSEYNPSTKRKNKAGDNSSHQDQDNIQHVEYEPQPLVNYSDNTSNKKKKDKSQQSYQNKPKKEKKEIIIYEYETD